MDELPTPEFNLPLDDFLQRFGDLFLRRESRTKMKLYVRGLLADVERKNGWQLAEAVGLSDPHPLQRLLNEAKWDADEVLQRNRQIALEQMSASGVLVIDESGFVKKGRESAGVQRQYCGRIGKVDNCQVGVFVTYATSHGTILLDRRLYVPKDWCSDEPRREKAAIPAETTFRTKPELAQDMLRQVWSEGLDPRYVTGDTLYGNSSPLRRFLAEHEQVYVLQIGSNHRVTVDGARMSLSQIAGDVPAEPWEKFSFTISEKGPIWYEWRRLRVEMPTDELGEQWLLLRRSPNAPEDVDFFVSNADPQVPLTELAAAAGMRHEIEQTFQEAKSELGLADYEVRTWHGWHRHVTLCILAHTWLTLLSQPLREKKSPAAFSELQPR